MRKFGCFALSLFPVWALVLLGTAMVYITERDTLYSAEARLGDQTVNVRVMTEGRLLIRGVDLMGSRELLWKNGQIVRRWAVSGRGRPLVIGYMPVSTAELKLYRQFFPA